MTPKERSIWLQVRRGILQINDALEQLLEVGKHEPTERSFDGFQEQNTKQSARRQ